MVKLQSTLNRAKLAKYTPLKPVNRNATRWSSTYKMLKRFNEIYVFIKALAEVDEDLLKLLPDEAHIQHLGVWLSDLQFLWECSEYLQRADCTIAEARATFNVILHKFGSSEYSTKKSNYLSTGSSSIHDTNFENAIFSIQMGVDLTPNEAKGVSHLVAAPAVAPTGENGTFATINSELCRLQNVRNAVGKRYIDTSFIPATSCEIERLFSRAKFIRNSLRARLDLENFESLLYLYYNKKFWDKDTLHKILKV